jgi:predicted permease
MITGLVQDLRISLKQMRRHPVFTLTAVLTLAIGLGVNAVAFTVVNGILFKKSAIETDGSVGRIATTPGGDEEGNASLPEYRRFADGARGIIDIAAEGRLSMAWRHDGSTRAAWVLMVSPNYFSIVDVRPIVGRVDVGRGAGPASVVIGERFWRRELNAPSLAGLTLRLNGADVSVAGVLPESFRGPSGLYAPDVWVPLDDLSLFNAAAALQKRDQRWLFLFGRIQPGVSIPAAQGHIEVAAAAMAHDWPDTHRGRGARFKPFQEGNRELGRLSTAAAVAMGIIGLVLLLACFNVANLLLARAVERERDMAIRAAIGAGTLRLLRLVVTDGMMIAGLAGAGALVLSWWTQSLVGSFAIPIEEPQHIDLAPDGKVVGFVMLLAFVAGVLPGLWAALSAARVDVARALGAQGTNAAGARPSRARRWLVGAQIAGSTAFLVIAALFVQSYVRLSAANMGFDQDHLVVAEFDPASHGYDGARAERYVDRLLARVRALPGVVDVAVADRAPFFVGFDRLTPVSAAGAPCESDVCPKFPTLSVGPDYFRTMGISLTSGREFERRAALEEVVVNQELAQQLWPGGEALGQTVRIGARGVSATVIGITARTHTRTLNRERPTLYVPVAAEDFEGRLTMVARTTSPPEPLVRPVLEAAQTLDPNVAMTSVKTMKQRMAVQLWPFRTISRLFSICGFLALVLATVGLAGVVIYAVTRRLREFGVRMSLGATPANLVSEVLAGSVGLLLPGLVAGVLLAAAAARLVEAAFIGVNVLNPMVYLEVALLECVIVVLACIGPALRAGRVDPLKALRSD